ncbi:MAG: GDSL-type esterase/lipase family protein [Oscillospiraceae bacterium]
MKKFLAVMLAGAMVLAMAGCSGGNSSTGDAADPSVAESTVASDADSAPADDAAVNTDDAAAQNGTVLSNPMKSDLISAAIQSSLRLDEATATGAAEKMLPLLMYTEGNPARIAKVLQKLQAGEEVTVAFLGGSITQGTGADNENCYAALTAKWIQEQYPSATVNYVNAGIGATGSYIGVHRCDTQVLNSDPDLVFIDFSVNDTSDRNTLNKLTYEGLIRKIWKHDTAPGIICVAMTQDNGTSVQEAHGEVTEKYSVPFVSYHDAMLDFLNSSDSVQWSDISGDNIHPNMAGHAILSSMLTTYLQYIADNLGSIDTTDPALASPGDSGEKYEHAQLLTTDDAQPVSAGAFQQKQMDFGGFKNPWIAKSSDGNYTEDDALVIEVEAQNIGMLYGKLTNNAGLADIYIDDEFVTTINADFSGGWGNYVEFTEVKSFMTSGKHTLKIVPKGVEGQPSAFYLSGITIS